MVKYSTVYENRIHSFLCVDRWLNVTHLKIRNEIILKLKATQTPETRPSKLGMFTLYTKTFTNHDRTNIKHSVKQKWWCWLLVQKNTAARERMQLTLNASFSTSSVFNLLLFLWKCVFLVVINFSTQHWK